MSHFVRAFILLLAFVFLLSAKCLANPGDTTWVQAQNDVPLYWYNDFDTPVNFPSVVRHMKLYSFNLNPIVNTKNVHFMKSPDSKLVVKMRAGDVSAFDSLYWRYYEVVYRNILKLTKDPLVSEDILQEVFIRLWEKRQDINYEQPVVNWIFVISFNLSIDFTRKKLREQELHRKLLADSDAMPQNASVYEEYYQLLKRAIDQLSPQKQRIIKLCKLEGYTYEEAAAEMKISKHTVKEYLSAAMASLGEYVRQHTNKASGMGYLV